MKTPKAFDAMVKVVLAYHAYPVLNGAVIRAMCSDDIAAVVRDYDAEQIVRALCEKKGYKVHMISIGHETE